jgi:hypothetical protein
MGGAAWPRAHATYAVLGSGGPLAYFLSSGCFSCKNIQATKILGQFEFKKVLETLKYTKYRCFLFCKVITKIRGIDEKS